MGLEWEDHDCRLVQQRKVLVLDPEWVPVLAPEWAEASALALALVMDREGQEVLG